MQSNPENTSCHSPAGQSPALVRGDLFGLPSDVRAIIEEHQARPTETNVFFGVDTVQLTTPDGLTELRCAIWENAGAVAWRLMQHWASCPNGAYQPRRGEPLQ